jgi:hypothetical protein
MYIAPQSSNMINYAMVRSHQKEIGDVQFASKLRIFIAACFILFLENNQDINVWW